MIKLFNNDKKLIKNFYSGIFNRLVAIGLQIVLIPIYIAIWGSEFYGEWLLLSTIPAYLTASDFGLNVTVTTAISALVAQKKQIDAIRIYQSASKAITYIGITVIFFSATLLYFFNLSSFLRLKMINENESEISILLLIIGVFVTFIIGLSLGIYRAEGRYDKSQNGVTIIQIFDAFVILLVIKIANNIIVITFFQLIFRIFYLVLINKDLKNKYNWFNFGINESLEYVKNLIPTSVYYMIAIIGQGFIIQGTSFIIGKQLGAQQLVLFNTLRTLTNSIKSFSNTYYMSFLPNFTELLAQNKLVNARKLFMNVFKNTILIGVSFIIVYYLFGEWFFKFWTHNKIPFNENLFLVLLISAFVSTLNNCGYTVLNSINQNKTMGIYYSFLATIATLVMYYISNKSVVLIAMLITLVEFIILLIVLQQVYLIVTGRKKEIMQYETL